MLVKGGRTVIQAIIAMIIANIEFKNMLKKCLIEDTSTNVGLFEYKGKVYDKKKFIELKVESLEYSGISQRNLKKQLEEYESGLVKSKTPDLDMALIEAYKKVIR